jgi:hypothetical protein
MQNVNPMILPSGNHHEIVNEPGRINSTAFGAPDKFESARALRSIRSE